MHHEYNIYEQSISAPFFLQQLPTNVHLRLREPHHGILKDPKSPVQGPGAHNNHFQPSTHFAPVSVNFPTSLPCSP